LDRYQQPTPTVPVLSTAGRELQNRLRDSASGLMLREQGIYQRHHLPDFSETRKHGFFFGLLEFIKTGRYCRRSVGDYSRHNRAHRFEQLCSSVLQTSLEKPIPFLSGLWLFARRARTTNIDAMGRELFAVR
jgi:hypothetical protein